MASSPLSGVLSPAQLAVVQQARAALLRPPVRPAVQAQPAESIQAQPSNAARPVPPRGRGQIVNIVV